MMGIIDYGFQTIWKTHLLMDYLGLRNFRGTILLVGFLSRRKSRTPFTPCTSKQIFKQLFLPTKNGLHI